MGIHGRSIYVDSASHLVMVQTAVRVPATARSWIMVAEGNEFAWPGYDLCTVGNTERYDYGFLPPRFFNQVLASFIVWRRAGVGLLTPRT